MFKKKRDEDTRYKFVFEVKFDKSNFLDMKGKSEICWNKKKINEEQRVLALIATLSTVIALMKEEGFVKNNEELKELIDKIESIHVIDV